jgi:hypothetical protein
VQLQVGDTTCIADLKDDCSDLVGKLNTIYIDMTRVHFFDVETEMRIREKEGKS